MIKYILIDVDGTLVDTRNIFYSSLNDTLRKYLIPETDDQTLFGMSVDQALSKLKLENRMEIKNDWEASFSRYSLAAGFFDNIVEMEKKACGLGMEIIIITSRGHVTADPICTQSELGPYIAGCIAAEDTVNHKPDPDPLLKAMEQFSIDPKSAIYIGDTFQDYQAASASGVRFALAGWNRLAKKLECVLSLNDPMDIFEIL